MVRLDLSGVSRRFGFTVALDGVQLSVAAGGVHAMRLGPGWRAEAASAAV